MSNPMKIKRELLRSFIEGVLQGFDPAYTVTDRLRMATFTQASRNDRIRIMGENYTYGEVLYRPIRTPEGQRSGRSTTRSRHHQFEVFVWHKFNDADNLENSSQDIWDDIIEDESGVIYQLESTPQLEGAGRNYTLSKPENISTYEVVMDNSPLELAHYLNFQITVRS